MRITTELLFKIANDLIAQRSRTVRDLVAVYLDGSLLREHPTIGGTTDIDLFFLHAEAEKEEREIVRVTDDIHVDISHHPVRMYRRAKELRSHPWLGPTMNGCKILYDPQHFLDFTQASVRGQFDRPEQVLKRVRPLAEHARQIWMGFLNHEFEPGTPEQLTYLRAIDHAVNAVAMLSGPPLPERRFLLDFPERAVKVNRPGLYAGLLGLLGAPQVDALKLRSWLADWRAAYEAAAQQASNMRLHPYRLNYYWKAFEALLEGERYQVVLWPMWLTWTRAVDLLPIEAPQRAAWQAAGEHLGVLGPGFQERLSALDAYLDLVDETLETWAQENGA